MHQLCRFFTRCLLCLVPVLAISMMTGPVYAEQGGDALPTVKLVYWRSIDDLPLYVGVEKGFF